MEQFRVEVAGRVLEDLVRLLVPVLGPSGVLMSPKTNWTKRSFLAM